eukprot:ctg_3102.g617
MVAPGGGSRRSGPGERGSLQRPEERLGSDSGVRSSSAREDPMLAMMREMAALQQQVAEIREENERLRQERDAAKRSGGGLEVEDLTAAAAKSYGVHGDTGKFLPMYAIDADEVLSRIVPVVGPQPSLKEIEHATELSMGARDALRLQVGGKTYDDAVRGRFLLFNVAQAAAPGVQRVALPGAIVPIKYASAPVGVLMHKSELGLLEGSTAADNARDVLCLVVVETDPDAQHVIDQYGSSGVIGLRRPSVAEQLDNVWFDERGMSSASPVSEPADANGAVEDDDADDDSALELDDSGFVAGKFYLWYDAYGEAEQEDGSVRPRFYARYYHALSDAEADGLESVGRILTVVEPRANGRRQRSGFAEEDEYY